MSEVIDNREAWEKGPPESKPYMPGFVLVNGQYLYDSPLKSVTCECRYPTPHYECNEQPCITCRRTDYHDHPCTVDPLLVKMLAEPGINRGNSTAWRRYDEHDVSDMD